MQSESTPTATTKVQTLIQLIRSARVDLSSEKRAQADVAAVLAANGIDFVREFRLSESDVVDFMVKGIAVELKLKRSVGKQEVYRQLRRYARHPEVMIVVLASNLSMGLPEQIEGKDAYLVKLGEAWL